MITSFGQFAIFITHYLSKMLVCPLEFSTRQKDRCEFFRFGEHAVWARSVRPLAAPRPGGADVGRPAEGRVQRAAGSAACGRTSPLLCTCESRGHSESLAHDAELHTQGLLRQPVPPRSLPPRAAGFVFLSRGLKKKKKQTKPLRN